MHTNFAFIYIINLHKKPAILPSPILKHMMLFVQCSPCRFGGPAQSAMFPGHADPIVRCTNLRERFAHLREALG